MKKFRLKKPKDAEAVVLSARLSPREGTWLRKYAKQQGLPIGTIARQMLEHVIKEMMLEELKRNRNEVFGSRATGG